MREQVTFCLCRNMDGLRDGHVKGSQSDRGRQMPYDIAYVWNLKSNIVTKGERWGERDTLGVSI